MPKENKEELLVAEDAIMQDVGGVMQAMGTITEYQVYEVIRNGKKLFSFRVSGLDDEEMENAAGTKPLRW
jgi:hypothetical protein